MIESKLYLTLIRIARSEGPQAIRLGRTIVVILDRISIAIGAATAVTAVLMNFKMSKLKQPPALKKCKETWPTWPALHQMIPTSRHSSRDPGQSEKYDIEKTS